MQKHHGYGLEHQFSRCSLVAMKNYYQLMQIAHLFNQLFERSSLLAEGRGSKESLGHLWLWLVGELRAMRSLILLSWQPCWRAESVAGMTDRMGDAPLRNLGFTLQREKGGCRRPITPVQEEQSPNYDVS